MATQVKAVGLPSGEYSVIDNGAAPVTITVNGSPQTTNGQTGLNWDKATLGFDTIAPPGQSSQDTNVFGNGTVPDGATQTISLPVPASIRQKASGASTGSVASLAIPFPSNVLAGNSIVVVCGVGNGTAPTISDTLLHSYASDVQIANGTAFNVAIFVIAGTKAGANTVTVNNGGAAASIAAEIYEVSGLVTTSNTNVQDGNGSAQGTATTTSPAVAANVSQVNDYAFAAFGLGTAAQTITVAGAYNNDSGQLNPTTPAGLFSFVSASVNIATVSVTSPSASVGVAEPWAVAVATFKAAVPSTLRNGIAVVNSPLSGRVFFKNPA